MTRIICACVTEDRPEFMPWLAWNFQQFKHQDKHLLIIDSSEVATLGAPWATVISVPNGTSIPLKRNIALRAAEGDAIAWMDDDDWQSPDRLSLYVPLSVTGSTVGWFYNLGTGEASIHRYNNIIFNSAIIPMDLAKSVRFDERHRKASDTPWMREIFDKSNHVTDTKAVMHAWISHETNISNPAKSKTWGKRRDGIGWSQETELKLDELRKRMVAHGPKTNNSSSSGTINR